MQPDVKELQNKLISEGYNIINDGVFGKDTKEALYDFLEKTRLQPAPAKYAFKSSAFVSGLAAVLATLFTLFNLDISSDQITLIIGCITTLITALGSIYGTVKRKEPITFNSDITNAKRVSVLSNADETTSTIIEGPFGS